MNYALIGTVLVIAYAVVLFGVVVAIRLRGRGGRHR